MGTVDIEDKMQEFYLQLKSDGKSHEEALRLTAEKFDKKPDDVFDAVSDVARESKKLNHLLEYEEFVDEGLGDMIKKGIKKVKEIFTGAVYRVTYTVTEYEKHEKDEDGNPEEKRNYPMSVNLKANGKNDAKAKLMKMFDRKVEGQKEPKPTVKVVRATHTDEDADKEKELDVIL